MKTNIFRVKEKNEDKKKIIIEEERTKNPFLLFLKRRKMLFLLIAGTIIILSLLASIGFAFSLLRGSNDYDISYVAGSDEINSNTDPSIDDDDIKSDLLGEESKSLGVVVLVKSFMTSNGDIVDYYTDGTAIIVQANGKVYRVFPKDDGSYGVSSDGKIDSSVKKILVEASTSTLSDGTVIVYYTDGTAKVELKNKTIFVRDSGNIKIDNGTKFVNVSPSGVALASNIQKDFVKYTDNTSYIVVDGKKYVVNKNKEVSMSDGVISYDKYNSFGVLGENTYSDGNVITIFENGSAVITDKSGNSIYVKKSGDILLKSKNLYEISPNDYGYSMSSVGCGDGSSVIYYDNGSAVIISRDGNRKYVEDSDDIIYDANKNIVSDITSYNKTSEKTTTNGEKVYNFSNGKSQVIESDGSSYIVDTSKLTFKSNGAIDDSKKENKPSHSGKGNPGEGIYVSEAENRYNDFKNVESTVFVIKNNNSKSKVLRIVIQEVSNYGKYNTSRLEPKFVKFQATIGDDYVPASKLTDNTWVDSNNVTSYVIYDGTIEAKDSVNVALSLYVDYSELDNSYQNKGFISTIKVYVEDEEEV